MAVGVVFGLLAGSVLVVRRQWPIAVVLVAIAITPAEMGFLMGLGGPVHAGGVASCRAGSSASLAGMSLVGTLIVTFVRVRQDMVGRRSGPGGLVRSVRVDHDRRWG
ncbi:hypothetical protein SHIRM173S_13332 [Streptomyces hirsutus]